ncbi:hypothetical protein HpHA275_15430 [Helicobacter pylori]
MAYISNLQFLPLDEILLSNDYKHKVEKSSKNNPALYNEYDTIKDTLAQARKLNGVLTLAFQDINQLDGVEGAKSIIENAAQVILYPTNNFEKLIRELWHFIKSY